MKRLFPFLPTRPLPPHQKNKTELGKTNYNALKFQRENYRYTHTHTHTHTATVHGYIRAKESPAEWCVGFEYGVNLSGNSKVYKVTP